MWTGDISMNIKKGIPSPRRKNPEPQRLDGLIHDILKTRLPPSARNLSLICDQWPDLVGEKAASQTMPGAFKEKILLVHATSPVWVHHMQFCKKEIVEKLNHALGRELVENIIFKIGPV
jgi:predicted nucleic acid-binding Zn ribbon protein